jgi:hypothetical protein
VRLCYLDDSGHSGRNLQDPQQPYYILGGLVVPSIQWRGVVQALKAVIRKATDELPDVVRRALLADERACRAWSRREFGSPMGWAAMTTHQQRTLVRRMEGHFLSSFEVHAVQLFQGRGDLEGVPMGMRLAIVDDMLRVAEEHKLDFLYVRIDKERHRRKYLYPDIPDKLAFMLMAEAFEEYLGTVDGEQTGMFIADYSTEGEGLKTDLVRYQEQGTPYYFGMRITRIVDSVHFVRSRQSPCTQLADVCSYLALQEAKRTVRWSALTDRVRKLVKRRKAFP